MDILAVGANKTVGKVLYGISKLCVNFNKKVKGVRKSKTVYPIIGNKENNFQVCFPIESGQQKSFPVVFYFHGGGWTGYDKCYYHTFCKRVAKMGAVVCNINYSLAPKSNLKQIIKDCIEIIIKAQDYLEYNYSIDKNKLFVAGDSAGAHISALIAGLVSTGKMVELYPDFKGSELNIFGTMLFYGVYDLKSVLDSEFPSIEFYVRNAMGESFEFDDKKQELSPINYVTNNFPKTMIVSGEIDRLHESQSKVFYEKLVDCDVDVQCLFFDKDTKMGRHGFIAFDDFKANIITRKDIEKFLNNSSEE